MIVVILCNIKNDSGEVHVQIIFDDGCEDGNNASLDNSSDGKALPDKGSNCVPLDDGRTKLPLW